jgi:hypothetical protein
MNTSLLIDDCFDAFKQNKLSALIESCKRVLKECLDKSVPANWHPLGFVVFKLPDNSQRALRLHLWPREGLRPAEPLWPIHNHIFDVNSFVVSGKVTNKVYRILPNANGRHRLYQVSYSSAGTILSPTPDIVESIEQTRDVFKQDSCYMVERNIFHSTFSEPGQFTATLVLTDKTDRSAKPLIVGDNRSESRTCPSRYVLDEDRAFLLNSLKEELETKG